jgi:hypothetical protein
VRENLTSHFQPDAGLSRHFEALVGITRAIVTARDPDRDGILGLGDGCPTVAETANGWNDTDGCPDALATLRIQVVDPTGQPVPLAVITVDGTDSGRTDAEGFLVLANLRPATTIHQLRADVNPRTGLHNAEVRETFALTEGETSRSIALDWRAGAVRVVTRTENGDPLDATVSFRGPVALDEFAVGADGEESFVLEPGRWTLLFSAEGLGIERR